MADALPNEIVLKIFSYLPTISDLNRASQVNSTWYLLSRNNFLWHKHYKRRCGWGFSQIYNLERLPDGEVKMRLKKYLEELKQRRKGRNNYYKWQRSEVVFPMYRCRRKMMKVQQDQELSKLFDGATLMGSGVLPSIPEEILPKSKSKYSDDVQKKKQEKESERQKQWEEEIDQKLEAKMEKKRKWTEAELVGRFLKNQKTNFTLNYGITST